MREAKARVGRGQNTRMGGSDPTAPQNRGPIPSGFGGHSRLLLLEYAARVLAAQMGTSNGFVRQFVIQNRKGGQKGQMAIIKAPPKQPKTVTIQARVEESVKTHLDRYAEFIDSSTSYVITEALKLLFKRDDEFKTWLVQQSKNGNCEQPGGGVFSKSA